MPTAIAEGGPIIKALDSIKAMDIIDKSSATTTKNNTSKELPQDYVSSPFSPADDANHRDGINNNNAQGSPEVAGNVHAWVSPNKSDEVASSKESSPDVFNQTSSPDSFNLNTTASSDDNKENENDVSFKSNVVNYGAPPIAVVGKRLHKPQKPEVPPLGLADVSSAMTEFRVDASKKDWIKIVHRGKEVMVMLHDEVSVAQYSTIC